MIETVIPPELQDAITPSGEMANDGREIYDINVQALPGGSTDGQGLKLGNDYVFRITGGALRVSNG